MHRRAFCARVKLTARLRHPNIVAVHDVGGDSEGPFAVLSLIGGSSLKDAGSGMTVDDKLTVLLKVCDALAYAHAHGVLHLDVKPANIQVGEFGDVYLLDWGLARLMQDAPDQDFSESDRDLLNDITLTGTIKGTPGFMAPEQADPDAETCTATDLYALGAVLFFLLTDAPPIQGDSLEEMLSRTQLGATSDDDALPRSLASIVRKATALDPIDRYDSVASFRADVERFRHGYATAAEEAGIGKQLCLVYQRNRGTCNLAAAFTVVFLVALTFFVGRLQHSRDQAVLAEQSARAAQAEADSQRQQAEEALQQVLREQQTGRQLETGLRTVVDLMYDAQQEQGKLDDLSTRLTAQSMQYSSGSAYQATAIMLEQLLQRDPKHVRAWRHLGCVRTVMLDFHGAQKAFEKSAGDYAFCADMVAICRKYHERYGDRRDLTPDELQPLLLEHVKDHLPEHVNAGDNSWEWIRFHLIQYDRFRRDDVAEHAQLIRIFLEARNPDLASLTFELTSGPDG